MLNRLIFISIVFYSVSVTGGEMEEKKELGQSATEWRHMYFTGITKGDVAEINLSEQMVHALLSMVGAAPSISTGAAVEPQYLLNAKGATPWLIMFAMVHTSQRDALSIIAEGKTRINIPTKYLSTGFNNHINWPNDVLSKYDLSLEGHKVFVIPFIVHINLMEIKEFSQSMKAPDGSLEIFTVGEFNSESPELLLADLSQLLDFIKSNRPDIVPGT